MVESTASVPRLSIQAQVRALCHLHRSLFVTTLVDQFSMVFYMYLDILHHVDLAVNVALHHDTPDWQVLNRCPPCMNKLENQAVLSPSMLVMMVGNQSLKLIDSISTAATPTTPFPPPSVSSLAAWSLIPEVQDLDDDTNWFDIHHPSSSDRISIYVDWWHNAGPESGKKMFALFAVTGIFVSQCRHGHCLAICDMVRSGKLSLGPRATSLKISGVVPAFHGHSHDRACQVDWHPLYQEGGCELVFLEWNALATGPQLSTVFHWHQAIKQFFGFWSKQKHAESGKFILHNYQQALDTIKTDTETLDLLCQQLGVGPAHFKRFLQEERTYFKSCKSEPPEVTAELDYMDSLVGLQVAGLSAIAAKAATEKLDTFIHLYVNNPQATKKKQQQVSSVRTKVSTTQAQWETVHKEVLQREEELNIYRLALDNLERLVVQHLFELTKLQLSGTKLLWLDILDMSTLADLDILRDTWQDIRAQPWAKPSHRRAMNLYFNIKGAREEIFRLNVEIPRLFTFLLDEHTDYQAAIAGCSSNDAPLPHKLCQRWKYQELVSTHIVRHLVQASRLLGFSGSVPLPRWATLDLWVEAEAGEAENLSCIPGAETEGEEEVFVDPVRTWTSQHRFCVIRTWTVLHCIQLLSPYIIPG
ncbi:hypothetical protein PYCCODRAFT_1442536 [Trametes coccinea BRFM310]|uniref:CxC1-like cysteine cluster associated with KDZ transposases domain-containing protein n=1 Tax=Trametes coccinea (strain BRFM310) TaxID=1353009 RepID=A0A1Y2IYU4_TRAC3|nr:hypothetical protein PYCCODRAFT_1442536 [Trametes coccinea BRFM310]